MEDSPTTNNQSTAQTDKKIVKRTRAKPVIRDKPAKKTEPCFICQEKFGKSIKNYQVVCAKCGYDKCCATCTLEYQDSRSERVGIFPTCMNCNAEWEPGKFIYDVCSGGSYSAKAIEMKKRVSASVKNRMKSCVVAREDSLIHLEQDTASKLLFYRKKKVYAEYVAGVLTLKSGYLGVLCLENGPEHKVNLVNTAEMDKISDYLIPKSKDFLNILESQKSVETTGEMSLYNAQREIYKRIMYYSSFNRNYDENSVFNKTGFQNDVSTTFSINCTNLSCNGMMNKSYETHLKKNEEGEEVKVRFDVLICSLCDHKVCKDCQEKHDFDEECNKDTIESLKAIRKDSKPCPKCGIPIIRSSGCSDMFCPHCKTCYHYGTGRIDTRGNSNPLYHEWRTHASGANDAADSTTFVNIPFASDELKHKVFLIYRLDKFSFENREFIETISEIKYCILSLMCIIMTLESNLRGLEYVQRNIYNLSDIDLSLRKNRTNYLIKQMTKEELVNYSLKIDSTLVFFERIRTYFLEILEIGVDIVDAAFGEVVKECESKSAGCMNRVYDICNQAVEAINMMVYEKLKYLTMMFSVFEEIGFAYVNYSYDRHVRTGYVEVKEGKSRSAASSGNMIIGTSKTLSNFNKISLAKIIKNIFDSKRSKSSEYYYNKTNSYSSTRITEFCLNDFVLMKKIGVSRQSYYSSSSSHLNTYVINTLKALESSIRKVPPKQWIDVLVQNTSPSEENQ